MINFLRLIFGSVLVIMLAVTIWASRAQAIWNVPREVISNPWFIATLFDTYFAFLTFYCWVAYRESGWLRKILWLLGILLLGNIAMAAYMLLQLFRVSARSSVSELIQKNPHREVG